MRFAILNTMEWETCRALAAGDLSDEEAMEELTGCAWLFKVDTGTRDVADAARQAVSEYFASPDGRSVLEREGYSLLVWEEAIRWMPDEYWERHGLELIRHPDVERVIVDADENLGESLEQGQVMQTPQAV